MTWADARLDDVTGYTVDGSAGAVLADELDDHALSTAFRHEGPLARLRLYSVRLLPQSLHDPPAERATPLGALAAAGFDGIEKLVAEIVRGNVSDEPPQRDDITRRQVIDQIVRPPGMKQFDEPGDSAGTVAAGCRPIPRGSFTQAMYGSSCLSRAMVTQLARKKSVGFLHHPERRTPRKIGATRFAGREPAVAVERLFRRATVQTALGDDHFLPEARQVIAA